MAVVVCAVVLGTGGAASAGRKRVVVLDFEGPKGEKFHDDLVKLIKKTHTVVPTEKWNGTAEQLAASTPSDRNIKKVARKLKIDAVVEGKVEKRRDEFIIRLKLHEGRSGELIGDTIDTKAEGPRIDGRAQRDLKDELIGVIDNVESNHVSGGGDDEDDAPAKKGKKPGADDEDDAPAKKGKKPGADDEDDDKPVKKGKKPVAPAAPAAPAANDDEDDKPARGKFSRRSDDERGGDKVDRKGKKPSIADEDDDKPAKKGKKPGAAGGDDDKPAARKPTKQPDEVAARPAKKPDDEPRKVTRPTRADADAGDDDARPARPKKVAGGDDDDGSSSEAEADTAQPLDAQAALSAGERALDAVFGLSVTMRRMSFAISPTLRARPPGYAGTPVAGAILDATLYPLALGHDRTDQLKNLGVELLYDRVLTLNSKDPMTGAVYSTVESRFGLAAVFRHAFGRAATSPVVLGSLGYDRQSFNVLGKVDLPDVKYQIIVPGAGLRFPVSGKLSLGADLKLLIIVDAGQIQNPDQYGAASVLGFEGAASADYLITPKVFARAALRIETIGYTFKGTGQQTNNRDGMPLTQDVAGARDSYFAGMVTVGYLY